MILSASGLPCIPVCRASSAHIDTAKSRFVQANLQSVRQTRSNVHFKGTNYINFLAAFYVSIYKIKMPVINLIIFIDRIYSYFFGAVRDRHYISFFSFPFVFFHGMFTCTALRNMLRY